MGYVCGEVFIMVCFDIYIVGGYYIVFFKGFEFMFFDLELYNYIDELMYEKFCKLCINFFEVCMDEVFLWRVYFDICGMFFMVEEFKVFVDSDDF